MKNLKSFWSEWWLDMQITWVISPSHKTSSPPTAICLLSCGMRPFHDTHADKGMLKWFECNLASLHNKKSWNSLVCAEQEQLHSALCGPALWLLGTDLQGHSLLWWTVRTFLANVPVLTLSECGARRWGADSHLWFALGLRAMYHEHGRPQIRQRLLNVLCFPQGHAM
jgi:hypothetical protein